jgi:hypothetical protein
MTLPRRHITVGPEVAVPAAVWIEAAAQRHGERVRFVVRCFEVNERPCHGLACLDIASVTPRDLVHGQADGFEGSVDPYALAKQNALDHRSSRITSDNAGAGSIKADERVIPR